MKSKEEIKTEDDLKSSKGCGKVFKEAGEIKVCGNKDDGLCAQCYDNMIWEGVEKYGI